METLTDVLKYHTLMKPEIVTGTNDTPYSNQMHIRIHIMQMFC